MKNAKALSESECAMLLLLDAQVKLFAEVAGYFAAIPRRDTMKSMHDQVRARIQSEAPAIGRLLAADHAVRPSG